MTGRRRLIVGIACAAAAVALMLVYISGVRAESMEAREQAIARYGGETVEVCVATRDISPGEVISSGDVEMLEWLVDLLPEGAITDSDEAIGLIASSQILENEPLSLERIGEAVEMASIPSGLSAVTVPSEDVLAVGGAVESGSLVNVYATDSTSVRLIGEEILVLETSNSSSSESGSSGFGNASSRSSITWVTLAVTPESVEEVIAASRSGNLYLSLPGSTSTDDDGSDRAGGSETASAETGEEGS